MLIIPRLFSKGPLPKIIIFVLILKKKKKKKVNLQVIALYNIQPRANISTFESYSSSPLRISGATYPLKISLLI
jgi:hypothetical protein